MYRNFSVECLILGVVLIFSLLVHEYGHALTASFFGSDPEITLEAFGGNAQYNSQGITPMRELLITINGPLFESILILVPYLLLKLDFFDNYFIRYLLVATMRLNIFWCLLNLIPIAPLDGGHIIRLLLERKFVNRGYLASIIIGLIAVICIAPYLFIHGFFFFGALLVIFGIQNFNILRSYDFSSANSNYSSTYSQGVEALDRNDLKEAKSLLKKLLRIKDEKIKNSAIESLAKAYFQENEKQKAYDLLLKADHKFLHEGKYLLCQLAFDQKNYQLIATYCRDIYDIKPTCETALLNSKAFASLNQGVHSGAWFDVASQFENAPLEDMQKLLLDPIYDSVRDQDDFKKHVEKIQRIILTHAETTPLAKGERK